jgi:hypothetical protein
MAKVYEEVIVIKLSKLVKSDVEPSAGTLATKETVAALEQVVEELVESGIVVEVELA